MQPLLCLAFLLHPARAQELRRPAECAEWCSEIGESGCRYGACAGCLACTRRPPPTPPLDLQRQGDGRAAHSDARGQCRRKSGSATSPPASKQVQSASAERALPSLEGVEAGHVPLFVKWEEYLQDLTNVTFVQVGGNCGMNTPRCAVGGDPIWEYATMFNWSGVVLEPVPRIFEELARNYKPYPNIFPMRAMVSNHSGRGKIQYDMGFLHGETSKEIRPEDTPKRGTSVEVHTYTLQKLWEELLGQKRFSALQLAQRCDILVVDAEGNELKILSGKIPSPKPRFILFEVAHMESHVLKSIENNLAAQGYTVCAKLKHQDPFGKKMKPQDWLFGLP